MSENLYSQKLYENINNSSENTVQSDYDSILNIVI